MDSALKIYFPFSVRILLLFQQHFTLYFQHLSDGFIAIVMPKLKEFSGEMNQLLPKETYFAEYKT